MLARLLKRVEAQQGKHRIYVYDREIKAIEPTPILWVLLSVSAAGRTGFEPAIEPYDPITA
jgi:hypothetical protein